MTGEIIRKAFGMAAAFLLLEGCGVVQSPLIPGSTAAAAKDQIMLVRKEPPSFGYERVMTQCRFFPDFGVFVGQKGLPDFLAETGNRDRQYFILYYLGERHAYACRTRPENRLAIEFAGPYPITAREYKLLDGFRKDPSRKPPQL